VSCTGVCRNYTKPCNSIPGLSRSVTPAPVIHAADASMTTARAEFMKVRFIRYRWSATGNGCSRRHAADGRRPSLNLLFASRRIE